MGRARTQTFNQCLRDQLRQRGFGDTRIREFEGRYAARVDYWTQQNDPSAATRAWSELFADINDRAAQNAAYRAALAASIQRLDDDLGDPHVSRIRVGTLLGDAWHLNPLRDQRGGNEGLRVGVALKGKIEGDARTLGVAQQTRYQTEHAGLWSALGAHLFEFTKGALGRQRNAARLENLGRAIFGQTTGDAAADAVGRAFRDVSDNVYVPRMQGMGVRMRALANRGLSQVHNIARIAADRDGWIEGHLRAGVLDWSRIVDHQGAPIPVGDRRRFLTEVYETKVQDGVNKLTPTGPRQPGFSDRIDQHRVIHYANFDAWHDMHQRYGDGNVFDVMVREMDKMAHDLSVAGTFGPSPSAYFSAARVLGEQQALARGRHVAGDVGGAEAQAAFRGYFDRLISPMADRVLRHTIDASENELALGVNTTANVITSAWLGSVVLTAAPTDFFNSALVRVFSGLRAFTPLTQLTNLLTRDANLNADELLGYGFVLDEFFTSNAQNVRFVGDMAQGMGWSRAVTSGVMQLNGNTRWTAAMRVATAREFGLAFARGRDLPLDQQPWRRLAAQYGITAREWDTFRRLPVTQPARGVNVLSPRQLLDAGHQDLYNRFAGMVTQEARYAILDNSIESRTVLRGTSEADTLSGAMQRSFAMFKAFPVTFLNVMTRNAYRQDARPGRLGFLAAMAIGTTAAGALAVQLRELSKGRDPMPVDDPRYWGKAALTGGGLGLFGDFLFNGTTEYGRGLPETIAGPIGQVFNSALYAAMADPFKWVAGADGHDTVYTSDTARNAINLLTSITPGSSIFYLRQVVTETLRQGMLDIVDPEAQKRRDRDEAKRLEEYGQGTFWPRGQLLPERFPSFSED